MQQGEKEGCGATNVAEPKDEGGAMRVAEPEGAEPGGKKGWELDGGVTMGLLAVGISIGSILAKEGGLTVGNLITWQLSLLALALSLGVETRGNGFVGSKKQGSGRGYDSGGAGWGGGASFLSGFAIPKGVSAIALAFALGNSSFPALLWGGPWGRWLGLREPWGRALGAVEFWGWSSVALYMAVVEALPGMFRPVLSSVRRLERAHNISLSLVSLALLAGISISVVRSGKVGGGGGFHSLVCDPFLEGDLVFDVTSQAFFWSKFWEWVDTFLLVAKGKQVTWLHYTHHASTAILTSLNMVPVPNGMWSIVCASNSFVHAWMYGYYAFPRWGLLRSTRVWLTRVQIAQHAMVLASAVYVVDQKRRGNTCHNSVAPLVVGLMLYLMYFLFFSAFYWRTYAPLRAGKTV